MIRPTGRALAALIVGLPVAAAPTIAGEPGWWPIWGAYVGCLALLLVFEFAAMPTKHFLRIDVSVPPIVQIGDEESIAVGAIATRAAAVEVRVDLDGDVGSVPPLLLHVAPDGRAEAALPLLPERRGVVRCTGFHARWTGPLGMLACEISAPLDLEVRVVPNVRAVRARAMKMVAQREFQVGLKIERYVGDGSEFDSLRDFVVGMDRRAVDWKATARHRKLLCREFRAERDHAVVLCIDTGRLMGEPLSGMPRLDHAIHAALQLGHVCLRTGDRVGLFAFADQPQHFVPPQAGVHVLQAIQERVSALDYGTEEANFTLGMTSLLQRLRRRSLVVMFTDFVDSVTAELMIRNVGWLARRHVLLFVAMRDPAIDELLRRRPDDMGDVNRSLVAADIHRERKVVLEHIRRAGAQVLDAGVEELGPGLIDRYLQVKRRELV